MFEKRNQRLPEKERRKMRKKITTEKLRIPGALHFRLFTKNKM